VSSPITAPDASPMCRNAALTTEQLAFLCALAEEKSPGSVGGIVTIFDRDRGTLTHLTFAPSIPTPLPTPAV
jgi:hypothetical protein